MRGAEMNTGTAAPRRRFRLRIGGTVVALLLASLTLVSPSTAFSGSTTASLKGTGAVVQANAYSCNSFVTSCSWSTSTKVTKNGARYNVSQVKNTATLNAFGIGASVGPISASGGSGSSVSGSWTNYNTWISDLSGTAKPNWLTWGMNACSSGFALKQGVKALPSACSW